MTAPPDSGTTADRKQEGRKEGRKETLGRKTGALLLVLHGSAAANNDPTRLFLPCQTGGDERRETNPCPFRGVHFQRNRAVPAWTKRRTRTTLDFCTEEEGRRTTLTFCTGRSKADVRLWLSVQEGGRQTYNWISVQRRKADVQLAFCTKEGRRTTSFLYRKEEAHSTQHSHVIIYTHEPFND